VEQHLALVVGGTAAEDLAVRLIRRERLIVPAVIKGGGLDVMMTVDEHPRRAGVGGGPVRVDGGQPVGLPDFRFGEAGLPEVVNEPLRRFPDVAVVRRIGRDRGDAQPVAQRLRKSGGVGRNEVPDVHRT